MTVLNTADAVMLGGTAVDKIYLGGTQVWAPPAAGFVDPRSIPGLVAWYSALAETGYTDNQNMSQWTDLSGNGNHAVPLGTGPRWDSTLGPDGGPSIEMETEVWVLPNALMSGWTEGTVAITVRSSRIGDQGWWMLSGNTGNLSHIPYAGYLRDTFGSDSQRTVAAITTGTWYRYIATSGADWEAFLDGVSAAYFASNVASFPAGDSLIGASAMNGSWPLRGAATEFMLYNRILTPDELADLDGWMVAHPSGGVPA